MIVDHPHNTNNNTAAGTAATAASSIHTMMAEDNTTVHSTSHHQNTVSSSRRRQRLPGGGRRPTLQRYNEQRKNQKHDNKNNNIVVGTAKITIAPPTTDHNNNNNNNSHHTVTSTVLKKIQPYMPYSKRGDSFWLQYSLVRDGSSLENLLQMMTRNHQNRDNTCSVLGIETIEGEIFGKSKLSLAQPSRAQTHASSHLLSLHEEKSNCCLSFSLLIITDGLDSTSSSLSVFLLLLQCTNNIFNAHHQ
jgi:hypothetical protein